jgi:hypothetical protein
VDDAGDRALVDNERGRDGPARIADHKRAGAVDRVDDDEAAAGEALEIVVGFFRKPPRLRQRLSQAALEQRIGGEIRVRNWRAAGFRLDMGGGSGSRSEIFERQRSGLARGEHQEIARGERVNVRIDAQGTCPWRSGVCGLGFNRASFAAQSQTRRRVSDLARRSAI